MQQASYYYPADGLRSEVGSLKLYLIGTIVLLLLLLVGLRLMPEQASPLIGKVISLLCPTLVSAAVGTYVGRNLRGWLPVIGLLIVSIVGMYVISALGGSIVAVPLMLGWGFVNGMFLGPLVSF